ncbi:MAG TPA: hypothetical protein DEA08_26840, partial [Planctomycetes bacterium]|nr:hypothetical protein [Planctomycetota bacterium]
GGGGGGGDFASTTAGATAGQVTSALPTVDRDASGYTFQNAYNNGVRNTEITALEIATVGTQTGVLVADAPFSNITAVASGTAPQFEVKASYDVRSFATIGTATYAATANRDAPGAGELYVRDAGTGSWSVVPGYGAENELIVAALDSATMVTAAGSIARPMKIAENGIEIAAINSARPTAALAYDGQMYIGATESGATGGACSLVAVASGSANQISLPVAAIGQGVFQRVTGMATADVNSGVKVLFVSVGEFDDQGKALSGSLLVSADGQNFEALASYTDKAPTAVAWIDSTIYVGTSDGELLYRDDNGDFQQDNVPTNLGITALLVHGTDLYIGCEDPSGAQLYHRVPNSGSVTPGPAPTPGPVTTDYFYNPDIAAIFASKCAACHNGGVPAAEASWPLTDPASMQADHTEVQSRLDLANPAQSILIMKAVNDAPHVGGEVIKKTDPEYQVLVDWVTQGAKFDNSGPAPTPSPNTFNTDVFGLLSTSCRGCHGNGSNNFNAGPDQTASYNSAVSKTNQTPGQEAMSELLRKASRSNNTAHGGGTVWAVGSPQYNAVLKWIEDGVLRQ